MTTQLNQLTELTTTSDGDLLLIRESATGVDKKMQAQNLRAKATTKADVGLGNVTNDAQLKIASNLSDLNDASTARTNIGLGNVDNVSAADLRDRSTHTGTQTLSTISDAGTMAAEDKSNVTGDVNFDSGTLFVDASANTVGIGTTNPSSLLELDGLAASAVLRVNNTGAANKGIEFMRGGVVDGSLFMDANEDINLNYRQSDLAGRDFYIRNGSLSSAVFSCFSDSTISMGPNGNDVNIDSSGNVGIGNTSPSEKLSVTGNVTISGSLSKGSGSFKIDHPIKHDTHHLVHSFVEAPQADNIYRGKVALQNGKAVVNLDKAGRMVQGTFEALNCNVQCFTTNEDGWTCVRGSVSSNILTIEAEDNTCTDTISWMVIGERCDQHMIDADWTDEYGRVITEPEKD